MRVLSLPILSALLYLAVACSGGGSSAPAETASTSVPETIEAIPSGTAALPGLVGFNLPAGATRGALAPADESREPSWANETEDIIVDQISYILDDSMNLVAVECRTTWCGIVVDLPFGGDAGISQAIGDSLAEVFDRNGMATFTFYRLDGSRWIAKYIEIRRLL